MARPVDETKIARVYDAAVRLIAERGYANTSVDQIARTAEVSAGYLYRIHPSKLALVQALYEVKMKGFHDHLYRAIDCRSRVAEVLSDLIDYLLELSRNARDTFAFLFGMLHDQTFEFPQSRLHAIRDICKRIHALGARSKELSNDSSPEIIFYTFFSVPLKFLDSRHRGLFARKKVTEADIQRLKEVCMNAIK